MPLLNSKGEPFFGETSGSEERVKNKLYPCSYCGSDISPLANVCPRCGHPLYAGGLLKTGTLVAVGYVLHMMPLLFLGWFLLAFFETGLGIPVSEEIQSYYKLLISVVALLQSLDEGIDFYYRKTPLLDNRTFLETLRSIRITGRQVYGFLFNTLRIVSGIFFVGIGSGVLVMGILHSLGLNVFFAGLIAFFAGGFAFFLFLLATEGISKRHNETLPGVGRMAIIAFVTYLFALYMIGAASYFDKGEFNSKPLHSGLGLQNETP